MGGALPALGRRCHAMLSRLRATAAVALPWLPRSGARVPARCQPCSPSRLNTARARPDQTTRLQTGLHPTSIELVAVQQQRVVTQQRAAPWDALLRALAARLDRLRALAAWRQAAGQAPAEDAMLPELSSAAPATIPDDAAQQQAWDAALAASSAEVLAAGQRRRRRLTSLESAVVRCWAEPSVVVGMGDAAGWGWH